MSSKIQLSSSTTRSARRGVTEAARPMEVLHPAPAARPRAGGRSTRAFGTASHRRSGIDFSKPVYGGIGSSRILEVLGVDMFTEFKGVKIPGRVVWCNFELARQLGFAVHASNRLDARLHEQLIDALSYKAVQPGEELAGRATVTMYADKYGGDGIGKARGSARAGFLPYGNISLKGIGLTPLFKPDDEDDFDHSHGGLNMFAALAEALFGEVNRNLFSKPSTRVLAIIDQDDYTRYSGGRKVARAIIARTGHQLRPAHVLARWVRGKCSRLDLYVNITRETGQLVTRRDLKEGAGVPDLKATMLRVIDDHAQVAAQQARWRITHTALSTSNMQMDGGMLDVTAQRANPRTTPLSPPAAVLDPDKAINRDYLDRVLQMKRVYSALRASLTPERRRVFNAQPIRVKSVADAAYLRHLELQLLCAAGLKPKAAQRLRAEHPSLAARFVKVLTSMTELKNPATLARSKLLIEDVAVVDVFRLLQNYPRLYFTSPGADNAAPIERELDPIYKGNRFHVAQKRAAVGILAREFGDVYRELMRACRSLVGEHYDDEAAMRASIESRAAFENKPLTRIYRTEYFKMFLDAPAKYKERLDADIFRELIDKRASASMRSVDALLVQGESRILPDGGLELQRRTIDGICYSVRARDDKRQTRRLHLRIPLERDGKRYVTSLPSKIVLSKSRIASLRYRFTTDEWKNSGESRARLSCDERGGLGIDFVCPPAASRFGHLEGAFYAGAEGELCIRDGEQNFRGYTFAIPDRQELLELLRSARADARSHRESRDATTFDGR
jgi:hypothetical protein